jgi:CPA2 family monovalent cation:H+ antiporter-2
MRDAFAVLFFVSVGMLLDPGALLETPGLALGALGVVLIGKPAVALLIVWGMRYPFKVALTIAIALSQIGEFSFILSSIGRELGILTPAATNTLVAVAIVSIVLNPLLYRIIDPVERWVAARPGLSARLNPNEKALDVGGPRPTPAGSAAHRAVVIGHGPTGRTVIRLLKENAIDPTVIELNMDTVRALRQEGVNAVYGDATRPDTLAGAGVAAAGSIILTSAGMANSTEVIRTARALNPQIRVLARAAYLRDLSTLRSAGADTVYTGEGEVALAFIEDILERLGATPEQIDRERARAHDELFGQAEA